MMVPAQSERVLAAWASVRESRNHGKKMAPTSHARAGDGGLQWMLKRLLEQAALDPLQRTELDGSADPRRSEV
jgi:hypothetical protein